MGAILGGLALGGLGIGASLMARESQNRMAEQAASQESMQSMMAMQQQMMQQRMLQQEQQSNMQLMQQSQNTAASILGDPIKNPMDLTSVAGYMANSPVFSTDNLKVGRNTLLGN